MIALAKVQKIGPKNWAACRPPTHLTLVLNLGS